MKSQSMWFYKLLLVEQENHFGAEKRNYINWMTAHVVPHRITGKSILSTLVLETIGCGIFIVANADDMLGRRMKTMLWTNGMRGCQHSRRGPWRAKAERIASSAAWAQDTDHADKNHRVVSSLGRKSLCFILWRERQHRASPYLQKTISGHPRCV